MSLSVPESRASSPLDDVSSPPGSPRDPPVSPPVADTGVPLRFLLGDWIVDVNAHRLERGGECIMLEPRPMAVLAELCRRSGEVVSAQALLDACWPGEAFGDNPVHKVVSGLRRALGDPATAPRFLETIRKRGYRVVAPIRVLSESGARGHERSWRHRSPFRGLESFGLDDAGVFFGRDDAIAELHARLDAQWRRGHPLVVLLGPSGSGKTSLVQAGLLPVLLQSPGDVKPAAPHRRADVDAALGADRAPHPGLRTCAAATADLRSAAEDDPWPVLAGAMLDWEQGGAPLLAGYSVHLLATALRERPGEVLDDLALALRPQRAPGSDAPLPCPPLLVIDRLESLFLPGAEAVAAEMAAAIDSLVRSRLVLVIAVCRNDFYPGLALHPALMHDKARGAHMDLAPPDASALAQIVRLPARAAGLVYGTDPSGLARLDDRLCADAMHARDALPLLQYALQTLYQQRAPGGELTWDAYVSIGGLEGAIGRRAEEILAALPQGRQEAWPRLLPRLLRLTGEDAAPAGRWVPAAALGDEDERALAGALVDARLLVADRVGRDPGFRVAHEALLRRWPRVTVWVAQHRAALAVRDGLLPWVHRWVEAERPNALLLPRGRMLWQASETAAAAGPVFGTDEREFIARSLARLKRQTRWRWVAAASVLALALLAVAVAVRNAQLARLAAERERQTLGLASFMLGDLADQLRPIGKLDLLASIGEQGLRVLGRGDAAGESASETLQRAKALVAIGEVNSSRGKSRREIAVPALREAGRLLAPLAQAPGIAPADYYGTLGTSAFWLGQIAFDADDLVEAAAQMDHYRLACEHWRAAAPGDPRARSELAFALSSLGSVAFRQADWRGARRWFDAALDLKAAALAAHPDDAQAQDAVASARTWLGQVAYVQGEPARALALYDEAATVGAALFASHPAEQARLRDLGVIDVRRAEALRALGRHAEAVKAMGDAVERLSRAVEHDPGNLRWQAERLHAQAGLLLVRTERADAASVDHDSRASLADLRARLAADVDGRRRQDGLWREASLRLDVVEATIALRESDPRGAADLARSAADGLVDPVARHPLSWQLRELQARLEAIGVTAAELAGAPGARTPACVHARDALRPAVEAGQAGFVLETWLRARACSGDAAGPIDTESLRGLTVGGYVPSPGFPLHPRLSSTTERTFQ